MDAASATDTLTINPVIYSELLIAVARIEELEAVMQWSLFNRDVARHRSYFTTV